MGDKSHHYFIRGQLREVRTKKTKRIYNKWAVQVIQKGEEPNLTRAILRKQNTGSKNLKKTLIMYFSKKKKKKTHHKKE